MFQKFVNTQPAPAEAGDFAGANPRASVLAPSGGFVAGSGGLTVGRFAWADPATGLALNSLQANSLLGLVHRENQGMIVTFLAESSLVVPQGYPVTLLSQGDVWMEFPTGAAVGDSVYADNTDGHAKTTGGGGTLTRWKVATAVPADAVGTGSVDVTTGVLHITAVASGVYAVGQEITGAGLPADGDVARAVITRQLTGAAGGIGTYQTTYLNRAAVVSTAITGSAGMLAKISTWQN